MNHWKCAHLAEAGVLVIALFLLLIRLGSGELGSADEAVHAQVAREMARDGHWLYPTYRGEPYFEKPPLKFWLTALTFRAAGESEWTARLWSALFGWGTVWGVMVLGRLMFNRGTGLLAGLVLVTTWEFLFNHCARTGELDSALLFFTTFSIIALWKAFVEGNPRGLYAAGLWLALGFLTKGHAALLPLLWLPVVCQVRPRAAFDVRRSMFSGGRISGQHAAFACVIFLGITAPWFLLQTGHYGLSFWDYMYRHNLAGYILGEVERPWAASSCLEGARYYLEQILGRNYPWPPMALMGTLMCFSRGATVEFAKVRTARFWLLAWLGATFLVFSLSKTRLPWYHLPSLIPMAVLAGFALERCWRWTGASFPRWNLTWLGLHVGLFFLIAGFGEVLIDWVVACYQKRHQDISNYAWYFIHDPRQRSVPVALAILPIGLIGLAGEKAKGLFRRARVILFLIVAVAFAKFGVFRPRESEGARETIGRLLAKHQESIEHGKTAMLLPVHLFDAYHEHAPHYMVSPARYYYLDGHPAFRLFQHPLRREQWQRLMKTAPRPCAAIIPSGWAKDFLFIFDEPAFRKVYSSDQSVIPIQKTQDIQWVYLLPEM